MAIPNLTPNRLEQLFAEHSPKLRHLFRVRARNESLVDDLMQELHLRVWTNRFRPGIKDPKSYLFGMAIKVLQDYQRQSHLKQIPTVSAEPQQIDNVSVEDDTTSDVSAEEVIKVLEQMPSTWRAAFLLAFERDYSYAQIATELGVTIHAAKKYLTKAMNQLRLHFNTPDPKP